LFEAGALAKQVGGNKGKAIPYLYGLDAAHLIGGPLAQLQARKADLEGTFDVVSSISREYEKEREEGRLRGAFDKWWPELERALCCDALTKEMPKPPRPTEAQMLQELLAITRGTSEELRLTKALVRQLGAAGLSPSATSDELGLVGGLRKASCHARY
jgi:hypothetical protein